MTLDMNDEALKTIGDVERFLRGANAVSFKSAAQDAKYAWLERTIKRFKYFGQGKTAKGVLRRYMLSMTGLSGAQLTRLIARCLSDGGIKPRASRRNRFASSYTIVDCELLAETDNLHGRLSGPATKRIFERQCQVYGDKRFGRLADISPSHIYNLRRKPAYREKALTVSRTKSVQVQIGVREKPQSGGQPGHVRVDTVHQGDKDGEKGVYHINLVDEVLQWQIVASVAEINDAHLEDALLGALEQFPFKILGFHSDNGGEFINGRVADMLGRLVIRQTKSRSGRTCDNALVEGKNGSVIRKHMGHWHIARGHADEIERFYEEVFNIYLNYHRPCGYATITEDERGRRKRKYETYRTPYERFLELKKPEQYLKEGITMADLEATAKALTDNECARQMQRAKNKILREAMSENGGMAKKSRRRPVG